MPFLGKGVGNLQINNVRRCGSRKVDQVDLPNLLALPITPDIVPSGIMVTVNMLHTSLNPLRVFLLQGGSFYAWEERISISTKTAVKKTRTKSALSSAG
jgi:hypothetical protein